MKRLALLASMMTTNSLKGGIGLGLLFAICLLMLASCAGTNTLDRSGLTIPLARRITFDGVAISIPLRFRVVAADGCQLQAGQVVLGLSSSSRSDFHPCYYSKNRSWLSSYSLPSPATGFYLGNANLAAELNVPNRWPTRKNIHTLSLEEDSWSLSSPRCPIDHPCTFLDVVVPSHDIGMAFYASGSMKSGALVLANRIVSSLTPVT